MDELMADFTACDRCSFFLAGYRALHGLEHLQAVGSQDKADGWITLKWDSQTRHLVNKSYGCRLDIVASYYDGLCPHCQRRFVIEVADESEESDSFRMALTQ